MDIVLHFLMENKIDSFGDLNLKKKFEIELSGKIEIIIIKLFNIRFFTQQADPKLKFYYCPPLRCNTQLKLYIKNFASIKQLYLLYDVGIKKYFDPCIIIFFTTNSQVQKLRLCHPDLFPDILS